MLMEEIKWDSTKIAPLNSENVKRGRKTQKEPIEKQSKYITDHFACEFSRHTY